MASDFGSQTQSAASAIKDRAILIVKAPIQGPRKLYLSEWRLIVWTQIHIADPYSDAAVKAATVSGLVVIVNLRSGGRRLLLKWLVSSAIVLRSVLILIRPAELRLLYR